MKAAAELVKRFVSPTFQKSRWLSDTQNSFPITHWFAFRIYDVQQIACVSRFKTIALKNSAGKICALEDSCPHSGWPLSNGDLDGKILTCLLHGAEFDATTGCSIGSFACTDVPTFPVVVEDGGVYVIVD